MLCQIAKWLLFSYGIIFIFASVVGLMTESNTIAAKRILFLTFIVGVATAAFSAIM